MAIHTNEQIKLDAATVAKGRCPECGAPLSELYVLGHAEMHYPERTLDPRYHADAMRRRRLLARYADEHPAPEAI